MTSGDLGNIEQLEDRTNNMHRPLYLPPTRTRKERRAPNADRCAERNTKEMRSGSKHQDGMDFRFDYDTGKILLSGDKAMRREFIVRARSVETAKKEFVRRSKWNKRNPNTDIP